MIFIFYDVICFIIYCIMYTALKALEKIFKYVEGTKIFMDYIDYILDYYSNNRFG